jgi:glutamate synthase domain-containing protein 1
VRKVAEERSASIFFIPENGFYINSLTSQTITYKGQSTPEQVLQYYLDLNESKFYFPLILGSFSINTFPSLERAQPIRMICH